MRVWKWIGVAGLAGVAATGVIVARNERQRRSYTPDDVRERLHQRAASIQDVEPYGPSHPTNDRLLSRLRRSLHPRRTRLNGETDRTEKTGRTERLTS
jgi:hypothetical protein